MNTLQTIYNKLSDKTELAKHEINLSLLTELADINGKAETFLKEYRKLFAELQKANQAIIRAKKEIPIGNNLYLQIGRVRKAYVTQAKELGINEAELKTGEYKKSAQISAELDDINQTLENAMPK
jgi:hypothetical protein